MKRTFSFSYDLTETRKAQGSFNYGKKEFPFEVTNVSNPIGDLLKAMVSLVQKPSHLWDEENKTIIEWYSEESIYFLELSSSDGKNISVSLIKSDGAFGIETSKKQLSFTTPFKQFYLTIILELDQLLKEKGLLNYAQHWEKDEFPLTWFLILKKYLINWKMWTASMEEADILESEFMMILS
jgi:hypothetical protein